MNPQLENVAWILCAILSVAMIYLTVHLVSRSQFNEHLKRGQDLMEEGNISIALEEFNRCVIIDSRNPGGYMARGEAHFRQGRHEDALKDYNKALELSPQGPFCNTARIKMAGIQKGMQVLESVKNISKG